MNAPAPAPAARPWRRNARVLARALAGERPRLRAMALTLTSLFAIVPALVVAFSVLQAFHGTEALWKAVHNYLLDNLAVGARTTIEQYLDRFVRNAHTTSAGLVGGAALVFSAVSLFTDVEAALNEVWSVRRPRPLAQRAVIYWAGLTLAPFLLAASLALGHGVAGYLAGFPVGQALVQLAAVLVSCLMFGALYLFVPATRVRVGAAALGGLAAGLAWEAAKALYALAVGRFFRYHAIYGSVAAIPIFLIWLYVSWTLVLFGARVSFVAQHARALLRGHAPPGQGTPLGRELLAARAMLEVALAFRNGAPAPDPGEVAERLETFGEPVREVLSTLRIGRLVHEVSRGGLVPARPLEQITLADVRRAISGQPPAEAGDSADLAVARILGVAEGAAAEALAAHTYADLCERAAPRPRPAADQAGAPRGRGNLPS